jgi:hypothetical protein
VEATGTAKAFLAPRIHRRHRLRRPLMNDLRAANSALRRLSSSVLWRRGLRLGHSNVFDLARCHGVHHGGNNLDVARAHGQLSGHLRFTRKSFRYLGITVARPRWFRLLGHAAKNHALQLAKCSVWIKHMNHCETQTSTCPSVQLSTLANGLRREWHQPPVDKRPRGNWEIHPRSIGIWEPRCSRGIPFPMTVS